MDVCLCVFVWLAIDYVQECLAWSLDCCVCVVVFCVFV